MGALSHINLHTLRDKQAQYYQATQSRKRNKKMVHVVKNVAQVEMDYEADDAAVDGESKAERFSRVVNPRLKMAVKRLRMIRQMFEGSTANNYEFTEEQRDKLTKALYDETDEIHRLMTRRLGKTPDAFDVSI